MPGSGGTDGQETNSVAHLCFAKGSTMIAAMFLIALIGQHVPPPFPPASHVVQATSQSRSLEDGARLQSDRVHRATVVMAKDIATALRTDHLNSPKFRQILIRQLYYRSLSDAVIFKVAPGAGVRSLAAVSTCQRDITQDIDPRAVRALRFNGDSISVMQNGRVGAITRLPMADTFLYAAVESETLDRL